MSASRSEPRPYVSPRRDEPDSHKAELHAHKGFWSKILERAKRFFSVGLRQWGKRISVLSLIGALVQVIGWFDVGHSFVCRHAPGVSWVFIGMTCDRVAGIPETPLYREQADRFLIAAKDGDDPFLQQMLRKAFRLRADDVCRMSADLAEVRNVVASGVEILTRSSNKETKCSTNLGDILAGGVSFRLSTGVKPLDQTLLDLAFAPAKCPNSENVWLNPPPSLLQVMRSVQTHGGMSAGFNEALQNYRETISSVRSAPREAFMNACIAQGDAERQGGVAPEIYTLIAFEPCKHKGPKGEWKYPNKSATNQPKALAACEARFEAWKRDSVTKEPYGWQSWLLTEMTK